MQLSTRFLLPLQDTEEGDSEYGFHHWAVPCHHMAILHHLLQRRPLHTKDDKVARLDLPLPPPQRHDPAAHLYLILYEAERGFRESEAR